MPLDGTNYKKKIKPLETGLVGLKQIGDLLRLPLSHKWTFESCSHNCDTAGCAVLTAYIAWPERTGMPTIDHVVSALNLPPEEVNCLFGGVGGEWPYRTLHRHVTPTDVADAIDLYIAGKEAEGRAA